MKEHGTVYPNCRNILKTPIKLNEGHTAFWWFFLFGWGALMVKDMKTKLPPQHKLLLTSANMSLLINSVCESIQSALLQACNLPPCCCLCFLRHPFPLFSLDFPLLSISNIFALLSVGYDAMHLKIKPAKVWVFAVWKVIRAWKV